VASGAHFCRLDSSSSSIHLYACSLVHRSRVGGDSKTLCIDMSYMCIVAVTTALDLPQACQHTEGHDLPHLSLRHPERATLRIRSSTLVRQGDLLGPSIDAGRVSLGSPRTAAGDSVGGKNS
jgi:hypothetical protein